MKMSQGFISSHIVLWMQVWLSNRLTCVAFDGVRSRTVNLKQGVPQWSALSTLLILFYIDDLISTDGVPHISLFSDDLAVWAYDTDWHRATAKLKKGLNAITSWSSSLKMELSVKKSECSFFAKNTLESKWCPAQYLNGQQMKHSPNQSSFESHMIDNSPLVHTRPLSAAK